MTIGTLLYIGIVIYFFVKYKKIKYRYLSCLALHIFTAINVEVGYFIKIGNTMIKYSWFTEAVMTMYSVIILIATRKKNIFKSYYLLFISIIVGIVGLILHPLNKKIVTSDFVIDRYWDGWSQLQFPSINGNVINSLLHIITFIIIYACITQIFNYDNYKLLLKKMAVWSKIVIVIGLIEIILKDFLSSNYFQAVIEQIFGVNSNVLSSLEKRGTLYRLSGLTTEASHYSYALFVTSIILMANLCIEQINKIWLVFVVALLILCRAFSSVLFLIALVIIAIVVRYKEYIKPLKKFINILLGVFTFVCVMLIIYNTKVFRNSYYGQRFTEILNDSVLFIDISQVRSYTYTSTRIRLVSIISTLKLIVYRPLFGIGIGTTSSHGSFAAILSGMGIVGTLSWLKAIFFNDLKKQFEIMNNAYCILILIWCVVGLFASMFWGLIYNAGNYILALSFMVLCKKNTYYSFPLEVRE